MSIQYVGVDFETTGLDLNSLRPIQVGLYAEQSGKKPLKISRLIFTDDLVSNWSRAAESIHGITFKEVEDLGQTPYRVDSRTARELMEWMDPQDTLVPVGYNVGSFDMEILRRWMPRTHMLFGHRSLDMNSFAFLTAVNDEAKFLRLKKGLNERTAQALKEAGIDGQSHDALYDATEAIFALKLIHGRMQ